MTAVRAAVVAAGALSSVLAGIRWLRVAQREHYLPGSVSRFALRWWGQDPFSAISALVALAGVGLAWRWPSAGFSTAVVVAAGPVGLGLRGRSSPLAWTRRARTLAAVWSVGVVAALVLGTLAGAGPVVAVAVALAVPLLLDLSAAVTAPFERAAARRYVTKAADRLRRVGPTVVGITGSYGKTSTKGYIAHLLAGSKAVVASPASFNNRAGLARAVNENLAEGTEVFLAEMGTYGPGEIAELCGWLPPDIAVITAIGPVHLERFGSEDRIVAAKAEILETAPTIVLNVDDPRLAALADRSAGEGRAVHRVSTTRPPEDKPIAAGPGNDGPGNDGPGNDRTGNDVTVTGDGDGLTVFAGGRVVARLAGGPQPSNVGCAVAVALALGLSLEEIGGRLGNLPSVPHRLESVTAAGGFLVLDDTYNANPSGARAALEVLARGAGPSGRRVVVTPGMVELGPVQAEENASFSRAAAAVADDLVIVGRTNRRALLAGARTVGGSGGGGGAEGTTGRTAAGLNCVLVDNRPEAVAWVRDHLGEGDAVLYENDLPDHYP